jgi:hypothetical protein
MVTLGPATIPESQTCIEFNSFEKPSSHLYLIRRRLVQQVGSFLYCFTYTTTSLNSMANRSQNFFERIRANYIRELDGRLLSCTGQAAQKLTNCWPGVLAHLPARPLSSRQLSSCYIQSSTIQDDDTPFGEGLVLHEILHVSGACIVGLIAATSPDASSINHTIYARITLDSARNDLIHSFAPSVADDSFEAAQKITDAFDTALRYNSISDKWLSVGRTNFLQRVAFYTSRNAPVQLCVPAFPCKSSNLDKVGGVLPDRGEYIALDNLYRFLGKVKAIYAPGAIMWIISDGHVFSDCSEKITFNELMVFY